MGLIDGIGLLGQRLALLTPTAAKTTSGGFSNTYAVAEYVRGRVTAPTNRSTIERVVGEQATVAEIVEITFKVGSTAVTSQMRVRTDDALEYELVELQRQDGYALAVGRRVV